jgi:hypothetical protein
MASPSGQGVRTKEWRIQSYVDMNGKQIKGRNIGQSEDT